MSRVTTSHNASSLRADSRGLRAGSQSARDVATSAWLKGEPARRHIRADCRSSKIAIVGAFDLLDSEKEI